MRFSPVDVIDPHCYQIGKTKTGHYQAGSLVLLLVLLLFLIWRTNFFKRNAADRQKEELVKTLYGDGGDIEKQWDWPYQIPSGRCFFVMMVMNMLIVDPMHC